MSLLFPKNNSQVGLTLYILLKNKTLKHRMYLGYKTPIDNCVYRLRKRGWNILYYKTSGIYILQKDQKASKAQIANFIEQVELNYNACYNSKNFFFKLFHKSPLDILVKRCTK